MVTISRVSIEHANRGDLSYLIVMASGPIALQDLSLNQQHELNSVNLDCAWGYREMNFDTEAAAEWYSGCIRRGSS